MAFGDQLGNFKAWLNIDKIFILFSHWTYHTFILNINKGKVKNNKGI